MSGATIKVEVFYDVPAEIAPPPPPPPAVVTDKIADVATSKLSGSGDRGGAQSSAEEPEGTDGTVTRERTNPVPEGCKFTHARVTISVTCADGSKVTLEQTGDVSAHGAVDGRCVSATTVDRSFDGRVTTTTTTRKRACCQE